MKHVTPSFPLLAALALSLCLCGWGCKERTETPTQPSTSQVKQELELARSALEGGDPRLAVSRAFALTQAHPDLHEARVLLAGAYILDGKPVEALIEANKVVEAKPDLVGGWVAKCAALHGQRRAEEGIEACEKALTIEPAHGAALKNLAALYGVMKRWDDQSAMLERLKVVEPDDSGVRIAMASNHAALGKTQSAIEEAKAGLQRDPKNVDLLFFIAQASWESDQIDQAVEYAELGVKFAPERTEILELFERAFMVKIASRLTCAHGSSPWTRDQKKEALADTSLRGVQGVIDFQRFYRDHKRAGAVARSLKRAVERCQPTEKPGEVKPDPEPTPKRIPKPDPEPTPKRAPKATPKATQAAP